MPFLSHAPASYLFQGSFVRFLVTTLFFLSQSALLIAQQPSYQVIGGNFLEGKDVYSLLESKDKRLWIGTDEGLFVYDGERFQTYDNPAIKNNSVFSLCENGQGEVYYCNFSGQIMRVVADSLEVYYELPDSLLGMGIDIEIDDQEELVIFCRQLVRIDNDLQLHIIYEFDNYSYAGRLAKWKDNSITLSLGFEQAIGTWKNGNFTTTTYQVEGDTLTTREHPELACNGDEAILVGRIGDYFLEKKGTTWHRTTIPQQEIKCLSYTFTKNRDLWVGQRDKGVFRYSIDQKKRNNTRLFPDYYISYYLEDSEGNMWLGTFKKGVLKVPNLDVNDFNNHPIIQKESFVAISAGQGDTTYAITADGIVYQIDEKDQVTTLLELEGSPQRYIKYVPWTNRLYFSKGYYDFQKKEITTIKTVVVRTTELLPPNNLLIADYTGTYIYSVDDQEATLKQELLQYTTLNHPEIQRKKLDPVSVGRTNVSHYQSFKKRFWLALSRQLVVLENGDSTQLTAHQDRVSATAIASWEDTTYVAVSDGLLKFVGTTYTGFLKGKNAPLVSKIRKIERRENLLYLMGADGFQRINLITKQVQTLNMSDGLLTSKVVDFTLLNNHLVLLTGRGLQKVKYSIFEEALSELKVAFKAIYINGKRVDQYKKGEFEYFEKSLEAVFQVPYNQERTNLVYRYRLLGVDSQWVRLPVFQNSVVYNSLSTGEYVLEVQALDNKRLEAPIARYAFVIVPPFWERWWFTASCILGIILLVSLFFWVRISILKRQNALLLDNKAIEKQLVESQQTALRSQMNPHFLFNALNSIQEMIIVNDKKSASTYLGKFADLMRLYLNHSREESISLREELSALQLYLELEQVRFEDSLSIALEVAPELSLEELTLPPMLVQPYVENAFKHGLLHKASGRELYIEFRVDEAEQLLCCTIKDNGVGRMRSAEIKKAQAIHHVSFASSATQRRLELLNYNRKKMITVNIQDLKNAAGEGIGTEVYLCVPLGWEGE